MRRRITGLALVVLLVAVPAAVAAFSATTSYSGNSFGSASIYPGAIKMATGSYTGTGAAQTITTGFSPDYVIVKDTNNRDVAARTSTMLLDNSKPLIGATALVPLAITSLVANGFTVGTNTRVNQSGRTYHWTAFKQNTSAMKVGTYTGSGGASQAVTGVNFSPEYVAVFPAGAQRATQRFSGMTRGFQFDGDVGTTTRITALNADGFTVANSAEVNQNLQTYHYVAFNDFADSIEINSYAGTGVDNRDIQMTTFQPEYVAIRANDTAAARTGVHRPASLAGDSTLFYGATAAANNRIQLFNADGFEVGTIGDVNANLLPITSWRCETRRPSACR